MTDSQLNIADLIFSHLKGTISEKDKILLDEWIKSSSENNKLFERLCSKEYFKVKSELYKSFLTQNRYSYIEKNISRKSRIKVLYRYSSIAAAVLVPILIVFVLVKYPKQTLDKNILTEQITPGKSSAVLYTADGGVINLEKEEFEVSDKGGAKIVNKDNSLVYKKDEDIVESEKLRISKVEVPRGGEYKLVLSDGTKVWLNSESSIKYPVRFLGDKRVVTISGEVYFDVEHDKSRPFIVATGDTKVEVLGTEFNVRAYQDEEFISTTLVKGKIRTWDKTNKALILAPSQQSRYNTKTGKAKISEVDTDIYTSWKDGLFVFNSQRLEDILLTISRWYDVEVFFEENTLRDIKFSGRLKRYDNAESLLGILEEMEDVEFKIKGKVIYVRKK